MSNKFTLLKTIAVIPVTAMLAVGSASAADAPKDLKELIAGAKKESTLRILWSASSLNGSKGAKHIVASMNKKYGTNIKVKFTPGPSMTRVIAKLTREQKAGQKASSDVVWNNSGGSLKGSKIGLFREMNWMNYLGRPMLKEKGFDPIAPNGTGIASAGTLVGVVYNSDMVKGADIPKNLADTLKPKWKGKIASTPYAAGMREFAMPDLLGTKTMTAYTHKLSDQIGGLMRCGSMNKITSGEFLMLVLSCGDQYVNQAKRRGEPLGYALMDEAVVSHTRYGSVPVHSQAPNAAALFVVWLHTKEGQKWMWEKVGMDLPLYPESHMRKKILVQRAKGSKVVMNSPQWLGSQGSYVKTRKALQKILKKKKKK
jgi:ABC-type Fe3+ transport system substrate-binding protein